MANSRGACVNRRGTNVDACVRVLVNERNRVFTIRELMDAIGVDYGPNGNHRARKIFRKLHVKGIARGVFDLRYRAKPRLIKVRFNKIKWIGVRGSDVINAARGWVKVPKDYNDLVGGSFVLPRKATT